MTFKKIALPTVIGRVDAAGNVWPSPEFLEWHEKLFNVQTVEESNIGSGLRATQSAKSTADAAASAVNAVQTNVNTAPSGAMTVTTNTALVQASGDSSATLQASATVSVAGGTANYTPSATKLTGDTLSVSFSPNPLTADGDITVTFQQNPSSSTVQATYRIDVTDSAGSPVTESVEITALLLRIDDPIV